MTTTELLVIGFSVLVATVIIVRVYAVPRVCLSRPRPEPKDQKPPVCCGEPSKWQGDRVGGFAVYLCPRCLTLFWASNERRWWRNHTHPLEGVMREVLRGQSGAIERPEAAK